MQITGILGYKNGTPFSLGRHLRDAQSAQLMISNDRILANTSNMLLIHKIETGPFGVTTMDMPVSLLDRLFAAGLLIDTGVDGLYGRSGKFEEVITRFEALIDRFGGADNPEAIRFPPA